MQIRQIKNKVEILLVVCILALFYLPNLSTVEFHNDESQWIATSNVFETYIKLDFGSSLWNRSYWTLTQPPMVRYVIGLSRYLGGYHIPDLNTPWDFNRGVDFNTRQGAMPSNGLLWWSRLPMAILAIASLSIVFTLLLAAWGRFAGYIWLGLVAFNPYFLLQLRRAMGESCLLFFTVLGLYAVYKALNSAEENAGQSKRAVYLWLAVAGIASGLAGASKLNGLANVLAPILTACVVALRSKSSAGGKLRSALGGGALAGICCVVVFVAVNPFLWPNPIGRTIQMFQHRVEEMSQQTVTHPVDYISNWSQRLQVVPGRRSRRRERRDSEDPARTVQWWRIHRYRHRRGGKKGSYPGCTAFVSQLR